MTDGADVTGTNNEYGMGPYTCIFCGRSSAGYGLCIWCQEKSRNAKEDYNEQRQGELRNFIKQANLRIRSIAADIIKDASMDTPKYDLTVVARIEREMKRIHKLHEEFRQRGGNMARGDLTEEDMVAQ